MTPARWRRRRGRRLQPGRRRQAGLGRAGVRDAARRLRAPRRGGRGVRGHRADLPRSRPARVAQPSRGWPSWSRSWGAERFRKELERRLGRALPPAGPRRARRHDQRSRRRLPPAPGRAQLRRAQDAGRPRHRRSAPRAGAARRARTGAGELRVHAARRTCCCPTCPTRGSATCTQEPLLRELPYNPSEVQRGLVSCTGTDFCNLALIDTKTRAMALAREFEQRIGPHRGRSPCAGRAARPRAATTTPRTSGCRAAR